MKLLTDEKFEALSYEIETIIIEKNIFIDSLAKTLNIILHDLPQNRDWLDPDLEKHARDLIQRYNEM